MPKTEGAIRKSQRLEAILDETDVADKAVCLELGIDPSQFSKWKNGSQEIPDWKEQKVIRAIERIFLRQQGLLKHAAHL